ncbi:MAG: toll/interleukin-1 receptor domain-containing protein, partial [Lachnospiraceae bacterium]|nr:toll/interleukin-1 receptor domain-containing protein [Lachnospiraceae bacterium]
MTKEELKITTCDDDLGDIREGYVFISYSSADENIVFNNIVVPLQEKYGLRVYCDKNFENHATQKWTRQMFENLRDAKLCLAFVSNTYISSYACFLEILTAVCNDIPILIIQLDKPQASTSTEQKTISSSTVSQFKEIEEMLNLKERDKHVSYTLLCYKQLKGQIEDGSIRISNLTKEFCKYLSTIGGTTLYKTTSLNAIKESITNEAAYVFENIPKNATSSTQNEELKTLETTPTGNVLTEASSIPLSTSIPCVDVPQTAPSTIPQAGTNYRYKGKAYDATFRVETVKGNVVYIVEAGSKVSPTWEKYTGKKALAELHNGKYVTADNIVTKDFTFETASAIENFITGNSTPGSKIKGMIVSSTIPVQTPSEADTPIVEPAKESVTFEYTVNHTDAQYKIITLGKQSDMGQAVNVTIECNGKIYNKKTHSTARGRVDGFGEIYFDNDIYENDKLLVTCDFALKKIIIQKIASSSQETEAVEKVMLPSQGIVS